MIFYNPYYTDDLDVKLTMFTLFSNWETTIPTIIVLGIIAFHFINLFSSVYFKNMFFMYQIMLKENCS